MTTPTLSIPEHTQAARALLDEADLEFTVGKMAKGAEMLWGAVAHALIAVALRQSRPYNSHGALKNAAKQLRNFTGQPYWLTEFNVAERYHHHFYHGQMRDARMRQYRPRMHVFVARLLAVANEPV